MVNNSTVDNKQASFNLSGLSMEYCPNPLSTHALCKHEEVVV